MDAPQHPVRFVTAASLFDGHDASINIMRRILQRHGAEVIHLGHNRSVDEVVTAAIQEDVHGVAVSSYQGGHVEYFTYLVELLRERGAGHVQGLRRRRRCDRPREIDAAGRARGPRIFSPEDGQRLGLPGMINTMIRDCDVDLRSRRRRVDGSAPGPAVGGPPAVARRIGPRPEVDLTGRRAGAGAGHHRYRWLGQVVADRRVAAPVPGATRRTRCASRCSPSTRPAGAAGERCSATGSG